VAVTHTPGPWEYVRAIDYWSIEPTGIGGKDNMEGNEADYRLIASAPDLLAALEFLLADVLDYEAWQRPCKAVDDARTAIAKARGQS